MAENGDVFRPKARGHQTAANLIVGHSYDRKSKPAITDVARRPRDRNPDLKRASDTENQLLPENKLSGPPKFP
jgi:hypothetical protein